MNQQPAALYKHAHDSGDGATVRHCFAGETRYWTIDGIKTLAETVGTTQMVLSNTGNGGDWIESEICDFGEQPLLKVTLKRNKRTKVVYATAEHRWLVRPWAGDKKKRTRVVQTSELNPEHRLAWMLPRTRIAQSTPSQFGIAHGIVYGDGTRAALGSTVNLWGDKDRQLLRYFSESRTRPIKTPNGVLGVQVKGLPGFFRSRPDLNESVPYLYGWLAGYFAADGSVSALGAVQICSASREDLEFYQLAAMQLGIGSYDITSKIRQGYGDEPTELFLLNLIGSTLRPDFFLTSEHRTRYEAVIERANPERIGWTVVSVDQTDRIETVYCAVVPGHENFVLDGLINVMNCPMCGGGQVVGRSDGTIECEFCGTAFTVQVQPMYSGFPQTDANGMPIPIPGMPGQIGSTAPGGAPGMEDEDGGNPFADGDPGQEMPPGAGEDPDAEGAPFPPDGDEPPDDGAPPPPKPKPDKKKTSAARYTTASGARLSTEAYTKYLAIRHAPTAELDSLLTRFRKG